MNTLTSLFQYDENTPLRVVGTRDEPLFVAADVCKALGIQNPSDTLTGIPEDEKGVGEIYTPGGTQMMLTLKEPGLYRLIFRSNKPAAENLRRWVFHEVLPSIRKTGGFSIKGFDLHDAFAKAKSGHAQAEIIAFMRELHRTVEHKPANTFRQIIHIDEDEFWKQMLAAHASGYLPKDSLKVVQQAGKPWRLFFIPESIRECLRRVAADKWPDISKDEMRLAFGSYPSWWPGKHQQRFGPNGSAKCWGFNIPAEGPLNELARVLSENVGV